MHGYRPLGEAPLSFNHRLSSVCKLLTQWRIAHLPQLTLYTPWTAPSGRGHGGRVVTLLPPTSEAGVRFPARPQVGNLVVACRWLAVYRTEPWRTVCTGFLFPSNYPSWYDLYSVESDVKPQINKCTFSCHSKKFLCTCPWWGGQWRKC